MDEAATWRAAMVALDSVLRAGDVGVAATLDLMLLVLVLILVPTSVSFGKEYTLGV
jgi:hypothetical protein